MSHPPIVYILSHIYKALAFEWIATGLPADQKLAFVLLNASGSPLEDFLRQQGVEVRRINYRGKRDFLPALLKTFAYLIRRRPRIVHAHLLDAQLIGLTAAKLAGVPQRIYTRHNSNYHHVYHPHAVRYDAWSNRLATSIVSLSQATDKTLLELEQVPAEKIVKIPHGFDLDSFGSVSAERTAAIRARWSIGDERPVIGVIARQVEWKGIQFIIPAFQNFLRLNPNSLLVMANAAGPYQARLLELLKPLPKGSFRLVPFEEDVAALYSTFDLYIHVPIDPICEAFGQTYVEALAAGVPSIFTLSGIAPEFVVDGRNALVVGFQNSEAISTALERLWKEPNLRSLLAENGRHDVLSRFGLEPMLNSLRKLYGR